MAKSFTNNPAEMIIKGIEKNNVMMEAEEKANIILKDTEKAKLISSYANKPEPKTKRIQLVVQPSLYLELKAVSQETGISLNELFSIGAKELLGKLKAKK